jgi:hypothetical protein
MNLDLIKILSILPANCNRLIIENMGLINNKEIQNALNKGNIQDLLIALEKAQISWPVLFDEIKKCISDINNLSCEDLKNLGNLIPIDFVSPSLEKLNEAKNMNKDLMNMMNQLETKINCVIDGYNDKNPEKTIKKIDIKKELEQNLDVCDTKKSFSNKYVIIALSVLSVIVIILLFLLMKKRR